MYRGRIEIMFDILTAINEHGSQCSKYQAKNASRTEYLQMMKYLGWAADCDLIIEERFFPGAQPLYTITECGRRFIELVEELKAFLEIINTTYATQTRYLP